MKTDLDHVWITEECPRPEDEEWQLVAIPGTPLFYRVFIRYLNFDVGIVLGEEPEDNEDAYDTDLGDLKGPNRSRKCWTKVQSRLILILCIKPESQKEVLGSPNNPQNPKVHLPRAIVPKGIEIFWLFTKV